MLTKTTKSIGFIYRAVILVIIGIAGRLKKIFNFVLLLLLLLSWQSILKQLLIYITKYLTFTNHIVSVMVSVLATSAEDRVFEPRSGQTKGYKIVAFLLSL